WKLKLQPVRELISLLRRHHPGILHLHFTGFIGLYPWAAKLGSVERVFFTDQGSRPAFHVPTRAPFWKRMLARAINWPISGVVAVSDYGRRCLTVSDLLPAKRIRRIYNSVDLTQTGSPAHADTAFRSKYSIPEDRLVVTQ